MLKKTPRHNNAVIGLELPVLGGIAVFSKFFYIHFKSSFMAVFFADHFNFGRIGHRRKTPGAGDGFKDSEFSQEGKGTGVFDFPKNKDTAEFPDKDCHLRAHQILFTQPLSEFLFKLLDRASAGMNTAKKRKENKSVGQNPHFFGQIRFIVNFNMEKVADANAVIKISPLFSGLNGKRKKAKAKKERKTREGLRMVHFHSSYLLTAFQRKLLREGQ